MTSLLLAAVALIACVLIGAIVVVFLQFRKAKAAQAALAQRLDILQQSLHALTAGAVGVDKRMYRLETEERRLAERQESLESQQVDDQPYARAIRLVQQGAGVHRLMEELELSESEAELIFRLHGLQNDA